MRITVVNQPLDGILPPDQTSIGIWSYQVARHLAPEHEVTVIGRAHGSTWRRRRSAEGVTFRFLPTMPARVWSKIGSLWSRVFGPRRPVYGSQAYYGEFGLLAAILVRRTRPDVIHLHNFTGYVPVLRALNRRTPIVLHMSGEWLSQLDEATIARRLAAVDLVLGTSDHITDLVRQRFPQYAERCHTLYNGVDLDAFAVDDLATDGEPVESGAPRIVFVGRVSPEKGVHDLLEAMPMVLERYPDATLELIGHVGALDRSFIVDVSEDPLVADLARFYPRDYGATLRDMAAPLDGHVRFCGGLSHDDVVRHVAAADLLVNPSYSESFGMSLVEAMACRTPVVATRVGGMREIVDDDVGRLVDPAEPAALAAAIVGLLAAPDVRRRMGEAGRARVEREFSWDVVAGRSLEFYTQVVGRGHADQDAGRSA